MNGIDGVSAGGKPIKPRKGKGRNALGELSRNNLNRSKAKNENVSVRRSNRLRQRRPENAGSVGAAADTSGIGHKDEGPVQRKRSRACEVSVGDAARKLPAKRKAKKKRKQSLDAQVCHKLTCSPFDVTKYTKGISAYDVNNRGDILEVPEYVSDLYQRLFREETAFRLLPYIHNQISINAGMRMIVVDWMVGVHRKFRLEPPTLHLSVSILDRYMSQKVISREECQLIAITSLFIAAKYEEIYPPQIRDCVFISDRAFTHDDVLGMEFEILDTLQFRLSQPTCYPFLLRFLFLTGASHLMEIASNFYVDRLLQEHDSLQYRPSLIAAAAVCLAINNPDIREVSDHHHEMNPGIPQILVDYTGFDPCQIVDVATFICDKVADEVVSVANRRLVAVVSKYDSLRYSHISQFSPPSPTDLTV